jgi:hypothetical protein
MFTFSAFLWVPCTFHGTKGTDFSLLLASPSALHFSIVLIEFRVYLVNLSTNTGPIFQSACLRLSGRKCTGYRT